VPKRHRADSDALAAAHLLVIMLRYLMSRGITTYRDVQRYQEGRGELGPLDRAAS
jgi:DNA polymerase III alpha subunit (gram-positive type)